MPVKVDRLSAGGPPSRIRQIRSPGKWALDLAGLNCTLRASGALDPGCMVLIAVERACESTICGIPLEDAMIVTIPAGTAVTASVKPGLRYAGAVVPTALWEEIQAVAVGAVVAQAADRPSAVRLAANHARTIRHGLGRTADRLAATLVDPLHLGHPHAAFTEYLGSLAEARNIGGGDLEQTLAVSMNMGLLGRLA